MKHGFIKVCSATVPIKVADVQYNIQNIKGAIKEACDNGANLVVFPELAITGATCGDLLNQNAILDAVEVAVEKLVGSLNESKIVVVVGAPVRCENRVFDCSLVLWNGKVLGVVPKTVDVGDNVFDYDEFDQNVCIKFANQNVPFGTKLLFKAENCPEFTLACELGEDLFTAQSPSISHAIAGATIIANSSAICELVGARESKRHFVEYQSKKLACAYIYSEAGDGESTTDFVYSGTNLIAEFGDTLSHSFPFKNSLSYAELDVQKLVFQRTRSRIFKQKRIDGYQIINFTCEDKETELTRNFPRTPFVPKDEISSAERTELILNLQVKALEKRIKHINCKSLVLGVSGGLDSTLALLVLHKLTCDLKILNPSDVIAVTMPGFGTTGRTYNNAVELIRLCGFTFKEIDIKPSVLQHFADIGHDKDVVDVTYENAQARMRTLILMDVANKNNGIVIGTGDLSELALGWATYNGDHMSMYGINASIPKTLVKEMVYRTALKTGGRFGEILLDVVGTDISPELLPPDKAGNIEQKTQDLVGPYELHDFFIYYSLRWGFSPSKIKRIATKTFDGIYDEQTIVKWLKVFYKRFFSQQFKRSCLPDGIKVGYVSLSPRGDLKMPSDALATVWLNQLQ